MKRLGTIMFSLALSVVIVYLGAGMAITQCLRMGTVTIGVVDDDCCEDNQDDCTDGGDCMKTTVMKLQPSVQCEQPCKVEMPMLALIPQFICDICSLSMVKALPRISCAADAPHAPPRLYLTLIRVLQI